VVTNIKKILVVVVVLVIAGSIMLVSISRATLEIMTKDEKEGRLRIEPVVIQNKTIYKLPQTNMLPDNVFYGLKEVRDWLWHKFSFGGEKEVKTMLILADKRIAESRALAKIGKQDLAFEAGMEAINKLKYANGLAWELKDQPTAQKQLIIQVRDATLAYREIILEIGQLGKADDKKYILLLQQIDDFKKEQEQKEAPENKEASEN
jgi:hypothetical protein